MKLAAMNTNKNNQPSSNNSSANNAATGSSSGNNAPATNNASGNDAHANSNAVKDPKDWTTGDETMTDAQRSYLHTLAAEAGEPAPEGLTKAEASEKIDELQHKTGRGLTR